MAASRSSPFSPGHLIVVFGGVGAAFQLGEIGGLDGADLGFALQHLVDQNQVRALAQGLSLDQRLPLVGSADLEEHAVADQFHHFRHAGAQLGEQVGLDAGHLVGDVSFTQGFEVWHGGLRFSCSTEQV